MSFEGKKAQVELTHKIEGFPELAKHLTGLVNGAYEWLRTLEDNDGELDQYDPEFIKTVVNAVKFAAPSADTNFKFLDNDVFHEDEEGEEGEDGDENEGDEGEEKDEKVEHEPDKHEDKQKTGKSDKSRR